MQLRYFFIIISLVLFRPAAAENSIVEKPWPSEPVNEKIAIQFQELEFSLPCEMVRRIALLDSHTPQLLLSLSNKPTDTISLQTLHGFKTEIYPALKKQGLFESAGIDSTESFFDNLALPITNRNQEILHSVLGTEKSVEYYKTSKGPFTAYRNVTEQEKLQSIIILLDGSDTVYEITGAISNRDYQYLLSGLSLSQ